MHILNGKLRLPSISYNSKIKFVTLQIKCIHFFYFPQIIHCISGNIVWNCGIHSSLRYAGSDQSLALQALLYKDTSVASKNGLHGLDVQRPVMR